MRRNDRLSLPLALLLLLAAALLFIGLGTTEIQPWDEGLYVVRADGLLRFGGWLDQTQHSPGGLYSATHPPVAIWLMAAFERIFGRNEWAFRLPGAFLGAASIWFLFGLLRRRTSSNIAAIVTLATCTGVSYVYLARHAQLDIYLFFFAVTSLSAFEWGSTGNELQRVALPALLFALALLSKFGFVILLAPLFFAVARSKADKLRAVYVLAIGCLVASPWYVMMRIAHPDFGVHALSVVSNTAYEATRHAWWYYLNQLVVAVPLVAIFAVPRVYSTGKITRWHALSLLLVLAVLLAIATSLSSYAMLLLLPTALLISEALRVVDETDRRSQVALFALVALAWLWSASEQLRLWSRGALPVPIVLPPLEIALMLTIALAIALLLWNRVDRFILGLSVLLALTLGQRVYQVLHPIEHAGARQTAEFLAQHTFERTVLLFEHFPHLELAPALTYYTGGGTKQWPGSVPIQTESVDSVRKVLATASAVIVDDPRHRLSGESKATEVESLLARHYDSLFVSKDFRVYWSTAPARVAQPPD